MPVYMKHGDVVGNVKQSAHDGWTQLQSMSVGVTRFFNTNTGSGKNREGGQISISEVSVSKMVEDSSSDLNKDALGGDQGKLCTIDVTTTAEGGDDQLLLQIILKDTLVSSLNSSGQGGPGTDRPIELLSLAYTDIQFNFIGQAEEGTEGNEPFRTGFDLAKNEPR